MNNIPTIEELDRIGGEAAGWPKGLVSTTYRAYITAIVNTVVAACKPQLRPIADMPDTIPDGCVRMFAGRYGGDKCWIAAEIQSPHDTHFIDVALPEAEYPADFERDFFESKLDAKDKDAAFRLWKGGVRDE